MSEPDASTRQYILDTANTILVELKNNFAETVLDKVLPEIDKVIKPMQDELDTLRALVIEVNKYTKMGIPIGAMILRHASIQLSSKEKNNE